MKIVLKCVALFIAALMCTAYLWSTLSAVTAAEQQKRTARRTTTTSSSSSAQLAHAKTVFAQNCARCHGADGRGETALGKELEATNFTDAEWQKKVSDKRIMQSVMRGRDAMPAFGKKLSRGDIMALCAYVRNFKTESK